MTESVNIVLPDDYVEFNSTEMEYSGGSSQAKAEAQQAQETQQQSETSVKDVILSIAPSIGQMAMMYFMWGGRGAAAPGQPQAGKPAAPKKQVVSAPSRISSISDSSFFSDDFDNNIPESVLEWNRKKKC